MAGGIEYSNFDRVGTVSILTRIQQEAVTDSGGRVREVLAYIRSVLTIGGIASQNSIRVDVHAGDGRIIQCPTADVDLTGYLGICQ